MKRNRLGMILLAFALLFGCEERTGSKEKMIQETFDTSARQVPSEKLVLEPLSTLSLTGDFDGDGSTDTIWQCNWSRKNHTLLDSFPSPFRYEWDTTMTFIYEQDSDLLLVFQDTLHLGAGIGLYCLLNVGDLNNDEKDEIAFVVDRCDFSSVNSCYVYSYCKGEWTQMIDFGVHESAFGFLIQEKQPDRFYEIPYFLEKKNGAWMYLDYIKEVTESTEEAGKSKKLKIAKCY